MERIYCSKLSQLSEAVMRIIDICKNETIWVFKGQMGAGKTTIIKGIAEHFQIVDQVSSPTFSLVNEYQDTRGELYFHFDFYRVEDPVEALDIGVDEYFYSGQYCWIEWAEKVAAYIPGDFALIDISVGENQERIITINIIRDGR
ncbi:tRNA (adenosine(37)-N6)-threonylcarbamoyltransferase complex ATPase subunit type 1 TsaE [Anditalea andensis]|uniref:tRNA threonylcarbamoyladenosine biosynthesis protein TsaE n=1 Tax=Anditalea andensis TaxID=1048983 RepID=A0A074L0N8_9BACT|nr:tRNA (adenosine(37)-N6)-threonylcarbamoyltransferase complex ATPase subunit type 1 TsaE [Anditalea andensis]KEO74714.1 ATPase [Anditalea andensis]